MKTSPNRTKYGFGHMNMDEIKWLSGDYRLIRVVANTYGKRYGKMFLVAKKNDLITIERCK